MSLRHALLGLLSIRPMSGYELKRVVDESVGHFWSADQSQVYRVLASLVADGLASRRTVVQDDRPNRHIHAPTDDGLAELDQWLAAPLESQPVREPFLARLFFADRLPAPEIRALLDRRRRAVQESLAALTAIEVPDVAADVGEHLRLATRDYGIAQARSELAWLEETSRRLDEAGA